MIYYPAYWQHMAATVPENFSEKHVALTNIHEFIVFCAGNKFPFTHKNFMSLFVNFSKILPFPGAAAKDKTQPP